MPKLVIPRVAGLVLACSLAHAQSEQVVFLDDFEAGLGNWTVGPGFQLADASSSCGAMVAPFPSGTQAAYYGDPLGCTFENAPWPTSLDLTAGVVLPADAQSARLVFDSYAGTECSLCEYDRRLVFVSADGGPWTQVGEGDQSFVWYEPVFDLTPFLGSTIRIRFQFDAVDSMYNFFLGWMIDDVRIVVTEPPEAYCSAKTNSLGCVPFVSTSGVPSPTSTGPFLIFGNQAVPEVGTLLYGFQKANLAFHGGRLCIKAPVQRLPGKLAKATGPPPCPDTLRQDFNLRVRSGLDPMLTPGQVVRAQWRARDPGDPLGFGDLLTDAVTFRIDP